MLASMFCCMLSLLGSCTIPTEGSEEDDAVRELKAKGASFDNFSSLCIYYHLDPAPRDREGFFVTIRGGWEGSVTDLRLLNKLRNLRELGFTHPKFGDDWCASIKPATSLESLFFYGRGFTNKGLVRFRDLPNLQTLGICDTAVCDEGLKNIEGFGRLRWLNLSGSKITDNGLKSVAKLSNLDTLILDRTEITGAGLKHVRGLTKLRRLSLFKELDHNDKASGLVFLSGMQSLEEICAVGVEISSADARALSSLKNLKKLQLPFCQISDKDLSHLADLEKLEFLDLDSSLITDASGAILARMKSLRYLRISNTAISDAIVPHLVQLPRLKTLIISGLTKKGKEQLRERGLN